MYFPKSVRIADDAMGGVFYVSNESDANDFSDRSIVIPKDIAVVSRQKIWVMPRVFDWGDTHRNPRGHFSRICPG